MRNDDGAAQRERPATTVVWVLGVAASLVAPPALVAVGVGQSVAVLAALAVPLGVVAGRVLATLRERRLIVRAALRTGLREVREVVALEQLADHTHGHFTEVERALKRSLADDGAGRRIPESAQAALRDALTSIEGFEATLRRNAAKLIVARRRGTAPGVGGLVAEARGNDETFALYGNLESWPEWVHPRVRNRLVRLGDVLDDVRRLHSGELEWNVLLLTMWSRALLIAFAPWLAGVSAGWPPPVDPAELATVPWAVATAVAIGTAMVAPWIATQVMRSDDTGARVRHRLLLLEVPLCLAAIIVTPCWPVVVFAAGWTNWAQRPQFNWMHLVAWIGTVLAALAAGCAIRGLGAGDWFVEGAVAMAVIFLVGDSYGAMLPVSSSLMTRVVIGGLLAPFAGRRRAGAELEATIDRLDRAADAIAAVPGRADDAGRISAVARGLEGSADREAPRLCWVPPQLGTVLDAALQREGTRAESRRAEVEAAAAERAGEPPPVTVTPTIFDPRSLARMRLSSRGQAEALGQFVIAVASEARLYGTGPLRTRCRLRADGRIAVRFVNEIAGEDRSHGRSSGAGRLADFAVQAGATVDFRGASDGSAAGLPARVRVYVVELSFTQE